jgi:hypothetical protein
MEEVVSTTGSRKAELIKAVLQQGSAKVKAMKNILFIRRVGAGLEAPKS